MAKKGGISKSAWLLLISGLLSGAVAVIATYLTLEAQKAREEEDEAMPIFDVRPSEEKVSA